MSPLDGKLTNNGTTSSFSSQSTATNILLNPSNVGNLQNQLMLMPYMAAIVMKMQQLKLRFSSIISKGFSPFLDTYI
jgi:hypothetical protein